MKATSAPVGAKQEPFWYYEPHTGDLPAVICLCGWRKHHRRIKVLAVAGQRHEAKTGHKMRDRKG